VYPPIAEARTSDGVRIAYSSVGRGDPLVLMPGVPFSDLQGEWQIPVLRGAFEALSSPLHLIQYDGRGTGRSQRDVADFSLEAMLHDLDAVVAATGIERFALLGFYHTSIVALAYAARHPERVSHLVLFGGSSRGWDPMRGGGTQALLSLIERDWDTFVESIAHAWLGWPEGENGRLVAEWFRNATTPEIARATLRAASGADVTNLLPDVTCPVLVLHRRGATVIPLEVSEALANRLPNGRLEILEGASASLFFEDGDALVARIVAFVTDERAGTATMSHGIATATLTRREVEVLRRIAAGDSNAEIAARLGVTVNTVERHVTNIYRKIDARGRADATAYAIRGGLA
jgi:pimeloyl-ACP methyl ester carboxylesterase/DNA-binding CsgD family transcriptional regulator